MADPEAVRTVGDALLGDWRSAAFAGLKALALFATAAAGFRLGQRRTMAEFALFDWVVAVAVGAVIGRTATASDTAWSTGAAALVVLIAAHAVVGRLRFLGAFSRVVDPQPRILIRDGEVDRRQMRRCGITTADLDEILRQHGHTRPETVGLAVYESKGAVSVLPR